MNLDSRKQLILSAVVRDYISTVKPVGSEELASRHSWGVKSATIRNELAELSDLGFLRQPHTSSGRIPSDQGYRFYVDHLMVTVDAQEREVDKSFENALELEWLLRQTCLMLSRATSYTSLATFPSKSDAIISHLFVAQAGESVLATVLFNTGQVLNRLVPNMPNLSTEHLNTVNNILNSKYCGHRLKTLNLSQTSIEHRSEIEQFTAVARTLDLIDSAVKYMLSGLFQDDNVLIEGAAEMMRQPEFRDATKFELLYDSLENGVASMRALQSNECNESVYVLIGSENTLPEMKECTLIASAYSVGTNECGMIGVIAPTRMNYDNAVPTVKQFASSLSSLLARLGAS